MIRSVTLIPSTATAAFLLAGVIGWLLRCGDAAASGWIVKLTSPSFLPPASRF